MDNKRQMLFRPVTTAFSILFGNLYSIMYGLHNEMVPFLLGCLEMPFLEIIPKSIEMTR
jgi:hypothetical protein